MHILLRNRMRLLMLMLMLVVVLVVLWMDALQILSRGRFRFWPGQVSVIRLHTWLQILCIRPLPFNIPNAPALNLTDGQNLLPLCSSLPGRVSSLSLPLPLPLPPSLSFFLSLPLPLSHSVSVSLSLSPLACSLPLYLPIVATVSLPVCLHLLFRFSSYAFHCRCIYFSLYVSLHLPPFTTNNVSLGIGRMDNRTWSSAIEVSYEVGGFIIVKRYWRSPGDAPSYPTR